MRYSYQRITIIKSQRPEERDINADLQWLGASLGLFNLRDKDKSMFRIFLELLKNSKRKSPLSSDEVADRLKLSRGTVMHHMNKLLEAGIVVNERNRYILREDNLELLVGDIQKDMQRTCRELREIAKEIDKWFEL
jgi:predicted transcriptional regulator